MYKYAVFDIKTTYDHEIFILDYAQLHSTKISLGAVGARPPTVGVLPPP